MQLCRYTQGLIHVIRYYYVIDMGPILSRLLNIDSEDTSDSPLLRDERRYQKAISERMKHNGSGCCGTTISAQEMREMIKDADNR